MSFEGTEPTLPQFVQSSSAPLLDLLSRDPDALIQYMNEAISNIQVHVVDKMPPALSETFDEFSPRGHNRFSRRSLIGAGILVALMSTRIGLFVERLSSPLRIILDRNKTYDFITAGDSVAAGIGSIPISRGMTRVEYVKEASITMARNGNIGFLSEVPRIVNDLFRKRTPNNRDILIPRTSNTTTAGITSSAFLQQLRDNPQMLNGDNDMVILLSLGANDILNATGVLNKENPSTEEIAKALILAAITYGNNIAQIAHIIQEGRMIQNYTNGTSYTTQTIMPQMFPLYEVPAVYNHFRDQPSALQALKQYLRYFDTCQHIATSQSGIVTFSTTPSNILAEANNPNIYGTQPINNQELPKNIFYSDDLHPNQIGYVGLSRIAASKFDISN